MCYTELADHSPGAAQSAQSYFDKTLIPLGQGYCFSDLPLGHFLEEYS